MKLSLAVLRWFCGIQDWNNPPKGLRDVQMPNYHKVSSWSRQERADAKRERKNALRLNTWTGQR